MTVKIVGEGSEEQGTGGLEAFVPENPDLLRADAILVCDTGNVAVGVPTLTASLRGMARVVVTVRTLESAVHSGMFGGAAPDALAALIRMLATLRDDQGNTTVRGLDATEKWPGAAYPPEQFRTDAGVLDGVDVIGDGIADTLWARPTATVLGIDCPPVVGLVRRGTSRSPRAHRPARPARDRPEGGAVEADRASRGASRRGTSSSNSNGRPTASPSRARPKGPASTRCPARCRTRMDAT